MRSIGSFGRREESSRSIGPDTQIIGSLGRDGMIAIATEDRQRGIGEFDATHGWRFPLDQKHRGKFFGLRHEYPSVLLTKGKRQPKSVVLLHLVEPTHCACQIFGRFRRLHRVFGHSFCPLHHLQHARKRPPVLCRGSLPVPAPTSDARSSVSFTWASRGDRASHPANVSLTQLRRGPACGRG